MTELPRLIAKPELLTLTGKTYPTIWQWMRDGKFPRSRIAGKQSVWVSTEVEAWMKELPLRPLKGDDTKEMS